MNFNHIIVPNPQVIEFGMFSSAEQLGLDILKEGRIQVIVDNKTKTRLYISLYLNSKRLGINHNAVEELKYHEESEYSYATYQTTTQHYLKVMKAQKFEAVQKHVEAVLVQAYPVLESELEELTIEYHNTTTLQSLQN